MNLAQFKRFAADMAEEAWDMALDDLSEEILQKKNYSAMALSLSDHLIGYAECCEEMAADEKRAAYLASRG